MVNQFRSALPGHLKLRSVQHKVLFSHCLLNTLKSVYFLFCKYDEFLVIVVSSYKMNM